MIGAVLKQSDRICIRRFKEKDLEYFERYRSLPEVFRYQNYGPLKAGDIEEFWQDQKDRLPGSKGYCQLAVADLETDALIGDLCVGVTGEEDQCELGIAFPPENQGKGYALESMRLLLDYLFTDLKMRRVAAEVDPRNGASLKLVERVGLRREGHLIENARIRGELTDSVIFALLSREWPT